MGKRYQPIPAEEPKKTKMRRLSSEEIEFHRQFLEDEPLDTERHLRFLPPADAELIRSVTREIDVEKLKQRSRELLEKYAADGYAEVPDVVLVVPQAAPTTPQRRVSEAARVARYRRFVEKSPGLLSPGEIQSHREFLEDEEPLDPEPYLPSRRRTRRWSEAKGHVKVPMDHAVSVVPPASLATPPGRVSEERIAGLRRFMQNSFSPIPERVLRSSYFSEAQAEVLRDFNRVCLEAEAKLKAHATKALDEYDAKGYLECTAEGKIKVTLPSSGSTT